MGGSQSQEVGGVRVFKVVPGSPAAESGLEVFFDFVIAINGIKLEPGEQSVFAKNIQEAENGTAKLTVYSTRANVTREVVVRPRKWSGAGLLGATVRFDSVDMAENHGIRVLEVFPNSPAAHAGLVPYQDFLLGTPQRVFHDIDELVEVVTANLNQQLQVYVYNADSEAVRGATLIPNNAWGGDGCIGCDIGTGLLHRIPAPRRPPGGALAAVAGFQPAYPPGAEAQVAAAVPPPNGQPAAAALPVAAAPAVVPGVSAVPVAGAVPTPMVPQVPVPGLPATPGLPQAAQPSAMLPGAAMAAAPTIEASPTVAAGMPAIRVGGTWSPAAAPSAASLPAAASPTADGLSPEALAQLQAQIQQMGIGAPAPATQLPLAGSLPLPPGSAEGTNAPPSTPMNANDAGAAALPPAEPVAPKI
eukprot:TRINITY_DN93086_c0_g1_i1.p1 TRINITY_DN93086_c0_g1~~TRINITY_DN93086_c0_g1_i1.p1  ORF type:complete len:416 (-),score=96.13 TRINITY_DN93086_c0_g1_i1:165-1412(-)